MTHKFDGVLCISGKATHGKTFSAEILKEMIEEKGCKVLILSYANYLKFMCTKYFGWDGLKNEEGRTLLQHVGTNLCRKSRPDVWINVIAETILALQEEFDYFIMDDSRFKNELDNFANYDIPNISIRINRIGHVSPLTNEQLEHPSETDLDDYDFDYYLNFETGKENVIKAIEESGLLDKI